MAIRAAIRSLLLDDPTLFALVGERVHPMIAATDSDLPFIVYSKYTEDLEYDMTTYQENKNIGFEFVCVSGDYSESIAIKDSVLRVLDAVQNTQVDDVIITKIYQRSESESQTYIEGREKPIYENSIFMEAWYIDAA
jgi:hypothetical protein